MELQKSKPDYEKTKQIINNYNPIVTSFKAQSLKKIITTNSKNIICMTKSTHQ